MTDTTLTPEQIADNARANKAAKPPKTTGKKNGAKASNVHNDALDLSVSEAQQILSANRQSILEKAIADQEAEDRKLYLNARVAASQNNLAFFQSISYANLSDRVAQKTAHILQSAQPSQLALAGAAPTEEKPVYSVDDFLDGLEDY
jgi:hypothetical protein